MAGGICFEVHREALDPRIRVVVAERNRGDADAEFDLVREHVEGHDGWRFVSLDRMGSSPPMLVLEAVDEAAAEAELREWFGTRVDLYFQRSKLVNKAIDWWEVDDAGRGLTVTWTEHRAADSAAVTVEDLGDRLGLRLTLRMGGAIRAADSNVGQRIEFGWALVEFEMEVSTELEVPYDGRKFVDLSRGRKTIPRRKHLRGR